jgi:hypothetical protein
MDRRLGELLPHQLANPTRATPRADCSFPSQGVPGISGSFPPLSPAPGHIPTRYSPVRRSPCGALDLHVLGLPPAFVLSQDQTLRLIAGPRHHPKTVAQSLIRALQRTACLLSKLQSQVPLPPAVSRQQKRTRPKHMSSSAVPRITRHRSLFQSSGTQPSRRRPPRRPRIPSSHDHLSKSGCRGVSPLAAPPADSQHEGAAILSDRDATINGRLRGSIYRRFGRPVPRRFRLGDGER